MGKHRIIAETGAGQHGVASATAARSRARVRGLHGLRGCQASEPECHPDAGDGAKVVPVDSGSRTLKDATNEAMRLDGLGRDDALHPSARSWAHTRSRRLRDFQSVIGRECSSASHSEGCPTRSWRAWVVARTRRASSTTSSTMSALTGVGGRALGEPGRPRGPAVVRASGRAARFDELCARTSTGRRRMCTPARRVWITRRRARARVLARNQACAVHERW